MESDAGMHSFHPQPAKTFVFDHVLCQPPKMPLKEVGRHLQGVLALCIDGFLLYFRGRIHLPLFSFPAAILIQCASISPDLQVHAQPGSHSKILSAHWLRAPSQRQQFQECPTAFGIKPQLLTGALARPRRSQHYLLPAFPLLSPLTAHTCHP